MSFYEEQERRNRELQRERDDLHAVARARISPAREQVVKALRDDAGLYAAAANTEARDLVLTLARLLSGEP